MSVFIIVVYSGGYSKPSVTDILWVQLIILPYTVTIYACWYASWVWRFNIKKEPYGIEEKQYLIRKNMKMGQNQYEVSLYIYNYNYTELSTLNCTIFVIIKSKS